MMDSARTALSRSVIRMKEPQKEDYFAGKTRQPVIWSEVEDFFRYFDHFCNPSGVQRVSFEICRAATTLDGLSERVKFCRLSNLQQTTPHGRLRRNPFRILEPARQDRSLEDILGAGNILGK